MTESDIVRALKLRHADDVFVSQCKTGPSATGVGIIDAWVMPRSWAHMNTIGYEVKVTRSDFVNDNKWKKYLPFCHSFYFAAPRGLIKPEELSDGVGLIEICAGATRSMIKRKAAFRNGDIRPEVYQYVLMCRTQITRESKTDKAQYWKDWLEERNSDDLLGKSVSKEINRRIEEKITSVTDDNKRLMREAEVYTDVKQALSDMGIPVEDLRKWKLQRCLEEKLEKKYGGLNFEAKSLIADIQVAINKLREFK
jgi:hypothetical protein